MKVYNQQDAQRAAEYVIYLRKSRADIDAEKRGDGETLARHEKILTQVAEDQGLKVVKVYKELVSGETIQDRPKMREMLKEINAGKFAGVLVVAADRLSRGSLQNMGLIIDSLKFSETLLVTPAKTYDVANNKLDEQMLEMQLFNSKQEYRAIVGRMLEGRHLSLLSGNYISATIPYGYDLDKPDKWTRTLKANADADTVREIFRLAAVEGMPAGKIATLLTTKGIKPIKKAKEWTRETVRDLLQNPVYIGKVRWKRVPLQKEMDDDGKIKRRHRVSEKPMIIDGKHKAIISQELWDAAQASFKKGSPPVHVSQELLNPLAGLLCCAKCGRAMRYAYRRRVNPSFYHSDYSVCRTAGVFVADVMALICNVLNQHIEDFTFKVDNSDKVEDAKKHAEEIKQLEKQLKEAQAKRAKLFDDYDDGVYTASEFKERKAVWADRIANIAKQIDELKSSTPAEVDYSEKILKFSEAVEALKNPEASAQAKNDLLREIVEKIELDAEGKGKNQKITLDVHIK